MGFKYHNKREYADYYAGQLMDRYGDRLRQAGAQAVIPVPLHAKKLRDRGYNQAEVLARRLGASLELPVYPKGLIRVQDTAPQKTLQGSQRGKNLYHAFRAGKLPKGLASVILVDDIYTTGATMNACSEALKKAGVRRIFCVSVCSGRNWQTAHIIFRKGGKYPALLQYFTDWYTASNNICLLDFQPSVPVKAPQHFLLPRHGQSGGEVAAAVHSHRFQSFFIYQL